MVYNAYRVSFTLSNSASAATAAIEQAQWSQTATTSQSQAPSSAAAANAMAQAQAAGSMGTVTADTTQQQTTAYQQQAHVSTLTTFSPWLV